MRYLRRGLGRPPVPRSPRIHGGKATLGNGDGKLSDVVEGAQVCVFGSGRVEPKSAYNLPPMASCQPQTLQLQDVPLPGLSNSSEKSSRCDPSLLQHSPSLSNPGTPKIPRVRVSRQSARLPSRPQAAPPLLTPLSDNVSPRSQKRLASSSIRRPKTVPGKNTNPRLALGCTTLTLKPPQSAPASVAGARERVMTLLKDMEDNVQESPRNSTVVLNDLYHHRFKNFLKGYAEATLHGNSSANMRESGRGNSEELVISVDVNCTEELRPWQDFWNRLCQQEEFAEPNQPRNLNIFGKTHVYQPFRGNQARIMDTELANSSLAPGSNRKGPLKLQVCEDANKGHTNTEQRPISRNAQAETTSAANKKACARMIEACTSLRSLVFGPMDKIKGKDLWEQRCGTQEEVEQLQKVWSDMDEDGSGDVEFKEFLSFFSKTSADKLSGMRCVNYLMSKAKDQGLDENEMGCTIQDMMHLIWLKANASDIRTMMKWFHKAEFDRQRVHTPDLLPDRKRRAIMQNFPELHWDERGCVFFQDLIDCGTIDSVTMTGLQEQLQISPVHQLYEKDVMEIFCPNGYRAHTEARTCVDKTGNQLVYVEKPFFRGWMLSSALEILEDRHSGVDI